MSSLAISSLTASQSWGTAPLRGVAQALTPDQQRQVARLKEIDQHVRAHEAAHMAAGAGVVTGGASYTYTYGPDGKSYAVGGEVGIDTSAEQKPQANIDKGRRIQAAALAPADPSPQDYRVASVGAQLEARGRSDLAAERNAGNRISTTYQPTQASGGNVNVFA